MKFKQMEYALAVARNRSFSQAAKDLYVSQPNVSSAITSLENELGFKIFERTNQGINLTPEGIIFISHAKRIMSDVKELPNKIEENPYHKLTIGCMFNHTAVSQAFMKLCTEYQGVSKLSFSLYTDSSRNIVEDIYRNDCELGIIFVNPTILDSYIISMENKNLSFDVIGSLSLNVNLRNEHPLLKKESFNLVELHDYPFVNYDYNTKSKYNLAAEFPDILSLGIVNLDKIINVDEKETRRQIVISTDAFSIGASYHPSMDSIGEIVSVPIPNLHMSLALVTKDNQTYSEELNRFIDLFKKELSRL